MTYVKTERSEGLDSDFRREAIPGIDKVPQGGQGRLLALEVQGIDD